MYWHRHLLCTYCRLGVACAHAHIMWMAGTVPSGGRLAGRSNSSPHQARTTRPWRGRAGGVAHRPLYGSRGGTGRGHGMGVGAHNNCGSWAWSWVVVCRSGSLSVWCRTDARKAEASRREGPRREGRRRRNIGHEYVCMYVCMYVEREIFSNTKQLFVCIYM